MAKKRRSRVRKANTKNWGSRGTSVPIAATMLIPSGRCPFIMEDCEEDSVLQWVALLTENKHQNITYGRSVYEYWARHSFDVNSQRKEYLQVLETLSEFVPERVKKTSDLMFSVSDYLESE